MATVFDAYGVTDTGRRRERNEDHFFVDAVLGLYIVADGMGGHAAGEVASHTAINTISDFLRNAQTDRDFTWPFGADNSLTEDENLLLTAIKLANREICLLAEERPEYNGMGTTIASLKLEGDRFLIAHVGDSRVYRLRDQGLTQLTDDHSWVNEQVARSIITEEEARTHRWRNVITRALGNKFTIDIELGNTDYRPGDVFVVCSDGLSSMLANPDIEEMLRQGAGETAQVLGTRLVERANEAGGLDNITAIVIRVLDAEAQDSRTQDGATSPGDATNPGAEPTRRV